MSSATKTKLSREAKAIVEDYRNRIGSRPGLVSEELQRALLATCVMNMLIRHSTYTPDRTIKGYVELYFEARTALMLNNGDAETDRIVAEKFGI